MTVTVFLSSNNARINFDLKINIVFFFLFYICAPFLVLIESFTKT